MKLSELKVTPKPPSAPKKEPIKERDIKPPKPPLRKTPQEAFFIDWDYLAHNSSFQRGFTEFIKYTFPQYKTIDHRASKAVMNQQLKKRTNEINKAVNVYDELEEIGRDTHQDFKAVVKELKDKLAKRKAKIQE